MELMYSSWMLVAATSDPTDASAQMSLSVTELVAPNLLAYKPSAHASVAIMVAQSRSLMLLHSSLVCPAVLPACALITETQQTLHVKPFLPGLLKYHHNSEEAAPTGSSFDTTAAAAAHFGRMAPLVYADDVQPCNASCKCCLMDSTSVSTAAPAATDSIIVKHTAPSIAAVLPDLRSWNWFQTLLFGGFMFSLGAVVPGMSFSLLCFIHQCKGRSTDSCVILLLLLLLAVMQFFFLFFWSLH